MDVLRNINAAGTTVLMATHDTAIVNDMKRRVVELSDGRIVRDEAGGRYQTRANPVVDDSSPNRADSQPIAIEPIDFDPIPAFDPMTPTSEAVDLSYLDRLEEDPL
jgi:cell division transport system ATP-binding protein